MSHTTNASRRARRRWSSFNGAGKPLGELRLVLAAWLEIFRAHHSGEQMHRENVIRLKSRWIVRTIVAILATLVALTPASLAAQREDGGPRDIVAPPEASRFQFLVGMWELQIKPKATTLAARVHGVPKMQGTWKAWRAMEGWGIVDELRIVDGSGNPRSLTHFVRVFDAAAKRWSVSALDVYNAKFTSSTMQWRGRDMQSITQDTDADGKRFMTRATIGSITPTSFRYQQDRSTDGGRSWTEEYLVIEAKRTAATAPR